MLTFLIPHWNQSELSFKNVGKRIAKHLNCMKMLYHPFRVPSSFHWWSTSLSSSTKPISTQPGLTPWAGSLDCSVFSLFLCGSSLKWLRWKGQCGRYVWKKFWYLNVCIFRFGTTGCSEIPHSVWIVTSTQWLCPKSLPI